LLDNLFSETIDKYEANLTGMVLGWSLFIVVSERYDLHP